jgi:DNA-binding transcriptional LysR family regulator
MLNDPVPKPPGSPAFADLHLLTILAHTRSYTQAARRLGVSKASVSMRIAELERAAGVALVRRTTRSVALTEAGEQLVEETRGAFERIEQSFAGIRDLAGHPRGLVRLTAPVALGRQHVVPALAPFLRQYPEIRLELDLSDRFVNLAQEGFDLAVRHSQEPPETHVAWTLCETARCWSPAPTTCGGTARRSTRRTCPPPVPAVPARPRQPELVVRARRPQARRAGHRPGARPLRANNSEALREAVLGGLGIGLLPDFSAGAHLVPRELVRVLPQWRPRGFFGDRIFAIRPWSAHVPRAVQCLVDHLREALKTGF